MICVALVVLPLQVGRSWKFMGCLFNVFFFFFCESYFCCASVWGADLPVDGEAEVWRELQPPQSSDWEACGAVCQRAQNRPAYGFSQWVLCPSQTSGTKTVISIHHIKWDNDTLGVWYLKIEYLLHLWLLCNYTGLLCGDPMPQWNGLAGAEGAADPALVTEGDLSAGICSQRPRSAESQVSDRAHTCKMSLCIDAGTDKWVISTGCVVVLVIQSVHPEWNITMTGGWVAMKFIQTFMVHRG